MKIISNRARQEPKPEAIPGLEVTEIFSSSIIVSGGGNVMSPEDIKRAEDIFKEIRRQLEEFNEILTP